ncbi:hypothetical protein TSAR_016110 [Trichomalopsis sarcophagae]|uniref:Odorant receptor n=1 Tax=Trichomalopsis sarcophagae TaxID=543379 RepID=A0A232FM77_9HYME|nr:hypothetical protein TSAR_016110 [Trichomalopsis sarcophagae]
MEVQCSRSKGRRKRWLSMTPGSISTRSTMSSTEPKGARFFGASSRGFLSHVFGTALQCRRILVLHRYCSGIIAIFIVTMVSTEKASESILLNELLSKISLDWKGITDPCERSILEECSKLGRSKMWLYFGRFSFVVPIFAYSYNSENRFSVYCVLVGFALCQMIALAALMRIILLLNESRPKILAIKAEYPFNYYCELYSIYCNVAVISGSVTDLTYVMILQQTLGLFQIVKDKMQKTTMYNNRDEVMVLAIKLHKSVLQFLELTESTNQSAFLLFIVAKVAFLSFDLVTVTRSFTNFDINFKMIEHSKEIINLIRMTMLDLSTVIPTFFFSNRPGQSVTDHNIQPNGTTFWGRKRTLAVYNDKMLLLLYDMFLI